MIAKRTSSLLIAGVATVVLSACGSSGSSKSDFIHKADAICARGDTQIKALPTPQLTGLPARQILTGLGDYVDRVLPVAQNVIGQLKALKPPSTDQPLLHRYFAALDGAVANLRSLSAAARQGNAQAVQSGARALNTNQPDALARKFGFKKCGGTGTTSGG